jgi:hypothetical protein
MSLSKKREVESESKIFQENRTDKYLCVSMKEKAWCSICSKTIAILSEYNTARNYNSKCIEKNKKLCQCPVNR